MNKKELEIEVKELENSLHVLMLELMQTQGELAVLRDMFFEKEERERPGKSKKLVAFYDKRVAKMHENALDAMMDVAPEMVLRVRKKRFFEDHLGDALNG